MFASHSMGAWFESISVFCSRGSGLGCVSKSPKIEATRTCISPANSAEHSLNAAKNVETNVRSELIFRAREKVDNKYKLCQTTSKATRRLHIVAQNTTDTINDALSRIAGGDESSLVVNPILVSS
ncbi:hypothetical protein EDE15_4775 [Edaphobacter aggregans]|uniref:Uncharacterized protein n=1 Tax=Edaphobacter aggregans TaxID=570835 RepID=A0A3R9QE49_9BACT|nr:hypothetical protein EDE15_4775 [Edaphobacter aggregans]